MSENSKIPVLQFWGGANMLAFTSVIFYSSWHVARQSEPVGIFDWLFDTQKASVIH